MCALSRARVRAARRIRLHSKIRSSHGAFDRVRTKKLDSGSGKLRKIRQNSDGASVAHSSSTLTGQFVSAFVTRASEAPPYLISRKRRKLRFIVLLLLDDAGTNETSAVQTYNPIVCTGDDRGRGASFPRPMDITQVQPA